MKYDDMHAPQPSWQSPTGSWKTYNAITEDCARQAMLDGLKEADASIAYVQAWATLDGAEHDSLSTARTNIQRAIKELSR
jgi:hypothetical protein